MDLIPNIIIFWAISIIVIAFINLKISLALYILYIILVPVTKLNIGSISITYNLINILIFIALFINVKIKNKKTIDFSIIKPFLFLYIFLAFFIIFTPNTPFDFQLSNLRGDFMLAISIPLVMWNLDSTDEKMLDYIKVSLCIGLIIASIYGIFLMSLGGFNPYTSFLAIKFDFMDAAEVYSTAESRVGFSSAGKIQSTTIHPMTWALHLISSIIVFITLLTKEKKKKYLIIVTLLGLNLLISGVRTGIAALMLGVIYYILVNRNFKLLLTSIFLLILMTFIILSNDDLTNLFSSMFDISGNKSDVSGSSISMRIKQFDGLLFEIEGNELFGNGYKWTTLYLSTYGDHPILLAFESFIFTTFLNNGIIGFIIWSIFFLMICRFHRNVLLNKKYIYIMDIFVLTYVAYIVGTGDYGYLQIFTLYYTFLLLSLRKDHRYDKEKS